MKIAITGASGMIGTALQPLLRADGHEILRLVRREPAAPDEAQWDPDHRKLDPTLLSDVDAVIHLAGVGVGDKRWTSAYKKLLVDSRVNGTSAVAHALAEAAADGRQRVLLSASAVGWYGDTGTIPVEESTPVGDGFLADLVRQWKKKATAPAADAGVRVVLMRSGLVCGRGGGVMGRMLPLFKAGVGGPMGSGKQYWPWISLPDELAAIQFLLTAKDISGPVNLTGPTPVTNAKFSHAHSAGRCTGRRICRYPALPCGSRLANSLTKACWRANERSRRNSSMRFFLPAPRRRCRDGLDRQLAEITRRELDLVVVNIAGLDSENVEFADGEWPDPADSLTAVVDARRMGHIAPARGLLVDTIIEESSRGYPAHRHLHRYRHRRWAAGLTGRGEARPKTTGGDLRERPV